MKPPAFINSSQINSRDIFENIAKKIQFDPDAGSSDIKKKKKIYQILLQIFIWSKVAKRWGATFF